MDFEQENVLKNDDEEMQFSDLAIQINPSNLLFHQIFNIQKVFGKNLKQDEMQDMYIMMVEHLEVTIRAINKIDDNYNINIKNKYEELKTQINNLNPDIDYERKEKFRLTQQLPFKLAQYKYELLYRIIVLEQAPISDTLLA